MPRYFINIYSNTDAIFDEVGTEFFGMRPVHARMIRRVASLALTENANVLDWRAEALDDRGKIVATMTFGSDNP